MISLQEIKPLGERLTKRRHIYKSLQQQIHSHRAPPGSPLPATHELAKHFAVSRATMQAAMDDLVRDGWLVRHQGKGTFTTDLLGKKQRPGSSSLVAVLPVQADITAVGNSAEVLQILHGYAMGASAGGARVEILSLPSALGPQDLESALQAVWPHDGALFCGPQYEPLIKELGRRGKHLVVIDGDPALGANVWYDREGATQVAVGHLLEHGYRRVAYFGGMRGEGAVKYTYFCQTQQHHGIEPDAALVQDCCLPGDAYQAAQLFLERAPVPEAVFVDNYQKATILVQIAQSRGLSVPQDLAVLAYGTETPGGALPLSFLAVPYEELGRQASIVLDRLVRGRVKPPIEKILKAKLVLRQSCGCQSAGGVA